MSHTGDSTKRTKTEKESISPSKVNKQSRINRLKQIDAIYKSQIQQIYNSQSPSFQDKNKIEDRDDKTSFSRKVFETKNKTIKIGGIRIDDVQNVSTSSRALHSVVSEQKIRSSKYIGAESTKTVDLLKIQNANKDNKIRDLTNKCEYLLQKLRNFISANQFSQEVESLNRLVENKIQRFQNLFKIKNEETFFKNRLQVLSLLQDFDIPKQELSGINDIQTQASLFTFLTKKIKAQMKTFRYRDQQNRFELHKDKILHEKLQERLTYLTQTNQLLKLSEQKLKQKNQSLKAQMHQFLEKMKQKELENQEKQCEIFRIKRESQQMQSNSSKVQQLEKRFKEELQSQNQRFEIKQKQLKNLLNAQNIDRKRLEAQFQEKTCLIEEMAIKQKYLTQENERINRQLLRSKERYEWCERELQNKRREHEQEKISLLQEFRKYKENNNESILLYAKAQTDEAMRKIEEYQEAYSCIAIQLQEQKKTSQLKYQQYLNKLESIEQTWLDKTKRIEEIREEELQQISKEYEEKHQEVRRQFEKKEKLVAEQMQAKMKALLAQKDKKFTERLQQLQQQNENIKKQLQNQKQLVNFFQNKK